MAPPSPEASIIKNAATSGEPSSVLIAAKLPAAATTIKGLVGGIVLGALDRKRGQTAAEGDQGGLGPDDRTQRQAGERRERDAGKRIWHGRPAADLQAVGR